MKLSKYKILFITPFTDKSWQIEFTKFTFIATVSTLSVMLLISTALLFISSPIIKEYLRISTINNEIKQQKEIISSIDETIEEIALMKTYIDSIIGTEKSHNLNEKNIRYMVTNNLPLIKPANGLISKEFDMDTKHFGIDIVNNISTPIFSTADGLVVFSDFSNNFGNFIIIDHQNGYLSHYYHNEDLFFNKGDKVKAGDIIAKMGNTGMSSGPHLHFEIWKDGAPMNPNTFFEDFKLKSDKLNNDEDSK
jgi:murein DD-endopeptidase MepM/ murein hydrolase activator NlpD|tara:strand:- start:53 stop:802 length:750 start_codon:yes stop_codon:yes gene_type:complete